MKHTHQRTVASGFVRRMGWVLCVLACGGLVWGCEPQEASVSAEDQLAEAMDFRLIVRDAKEKVFPAVVFIKCLRESHEMGKKVTQEVYGSGVIITPDGEVLSNWHVIDKAIEIDCLLYDGQALKAEVVGSDKDTDLALLKLQLPEADTETTKATPSEATDETDPATPQAVPGEEPVAGLPHATLGDSRKLKEGDFVMAMGAPYGLNRSVSIGIVSCTSRYLPDSSEYSKWLQTDAAINPGNSGGPLVNTDGAIVGIITRGGGNDLGFALPSENVRIIVSQLREFNKVNWSWTGLQLQPLKDFRRDIYFKGDKGVIVAETDPESPARRAGIKVQDRIIEVNGAPITAEWEEDLPAVRRTLGLLTKGEPATFKVLRGGETLAMEITPREKGEVEGEELDCPRWDMTVKDINQFDNEDLYFYRKKGVFIYGVKYPGNASEAGLNEQDIILKIGNREIETLEDVKEVHTEALENIEKSHRVLFTVLRNGLMRQVVLDFSRDYEKE